TADSPEVSRAAGSMLGSNVVVCNSITTLINCREIFPAMLVSIHSAKRSINFETYTFWNDEIGREFVEALSDAASRGVHVNAVLDAQGTKRMGRENLNKLQGAGVN